MNLDLDQLSLKELSDLQSRVERAIASFEDRRKQEALMELDAAAQRMGFSLADLTGLNIVKKRKPAAAKYINPENADQTWTGRGRKPGWVQAALEAGKSLADLAI
ncbi:H-NS histone family protein [Phaeovulum sp. W22_SRMD_FR3]|uniref:H-NS histone family protein n=1 Tax=Phaeovulum sp. W22_SRMD_FR3 TaxID=3240274 RepID=UPI003F950A9E